MSILLGFVALALAGVITHRIARPGAGLAVLDYPNERSLHDRPTPSGGGIAIGLSILATGLVAVAFEPESGPVAWIAPGAVLIAFISFVDDRRHLSVPVRLLVHVVLAGLLVAGGLAIHEFELPGVRWPAAPLVAVLVCGLYTVWLINLYNFMDGMDGFAAGMSVIGFTTFALLGAGGEQPLFVVLCASIAGAAGGFLVFNFPPARIFMGDVGSSLLGFLVAAFSLWAALERIFPLWISMLVFSPFVVDATVTLLRRSMAGHRVWEAHRSHYYQRLVQLGWGHRRTVLGEYLVMGACAISALLAVRWNSTQQWLLLVAWMLAYTAAMFGITLAERRRPRSPHDLH